MSFLFAETGEGLSEIITLDTVDPIVEVLTPNGGENYEDEEFIEITWSASDYSFSNLPLKIYFSEDGGVTYPDSTGLEENDSMYQWDVPDTPCLTAMVKITSIDEFGNNADDESDYAFSYYDPVFVDFVADTTVGIDELEVQFTSTPAGDYDTYLWDFGDGQTSNEQNPLHTYSVEPGITEHFTVSLTLSGLGGTITETKENYILVYSLDEFGLVSPSSFSVDMSIYPILEWSNAFEYLEGYDQVYKVFISMSPLFADELTVVYETTETYLYPPVDLELGTTYFWKVLANQLNQQVLADMGGAGYWMFTTVFRTEHLHPMIDGEIADDRTLIPENSPYYSSQNPFSAYGKDLTVRAGVEIQFANNTELVIGGNLFVNGTEQDSVKFTGYTENTEWDGIRFNDNGFQRLPLIVDSYNTYQSGNIIEYAQFENCTKLLDTDTDFYIQHSSFEAFDTGLKLGDGSFVVNSIFANSTGTTGDRYAIRNGVYFENLVIDNINGFGVNASETAEFINNQIENCTSYGVYGGKLFEENTISNNGSYGINANSDAEVLNNTIEGNGSYAISSAQIIQGNTIRYNNCGSQNVVSTSYIEQFTNNVLEENNSNLCLSFSVSDSLIMSGNTIANNQTRNDLISISGNTIKITDNTINQNGKVSGYGGGSAINITDQNGESVIENNQITHQTGYQDGGGIFVENSVGLEIKNNTISHNTVSDEGGGIYILNGNVSITTNTITSNTANTASAIYLNSGVDNTVVDKNIITNNLGEYAIWGAPTTLTQNNIFYNFDNADNLNLRYTGSQSANYDYNFWGTRSDQGDIDPSIYDDNESAGSVGMVNYQPILTAPSPLTPGQLSVIDEVLVTQDSESLNENTTGSGDGQTVFIAVVGEDGNAFSQDLTEVSIINMTTYFPLQPLMWETGENTGIYRGEISISATVYNPQQNIMKASVGDTLMITSTVDETSVFYLPIIETGIDIPMEEFVFDEDDSLIVDFAEYLTLPDDSNYVLTSSETQNVIVDINGYIVTFSAPENWNGSEEVEFTLVDNSRIILSDIVSLVVIPVQDVPTADDLEIVTDEDTPVDIMLTGTDADGEELSFSVITPPVNGTYIDGVYTPNSNYFGEDSFTYQAYDGLDYSEEATVTITINSVDDYGCMDITACNYDMYAEIDNGECTFAEQYYDCNGNCLNEISGDLNNDSILNVLDIISIVNIIIDNEPFVECGDMNGDNILNVLDIVSIVNIIMGDSLTRENQATNVELNVNSSSISIESNGNFGGIQFNTDAPELIINQVAENDEMAIGSNTVLLFAHDGMLSTTEIKLHERIEIDNIIVANSLGDEIDATLNIIPDDFALLSAYPNPFNPSTTINFAVEIHCRLSLQIFDINGRLVNTLVDGFIDAGYHSVIWNANQHSSGVYFVKMNADSFTKTQKVMLLK